MKRRLLLVGACLISLALAAPAGAAHAQYHWPGSGPRTIRVIDSVTSGWNSALRAAAADWSTSAAVDLAVGRGKASAKVRKRCPAHTGVVRVCNRNYGATGWAGLTTVWLSGNHIVKAKAKLNTRYVKNAHDRRAVTCHELGHALGLGHRAQSETSSCLTPRLDAGTTPDGTDIAELDALYLSHADSTARASSADTAGTGGDGPYRVVHFKLLAR